MRIRLYVNLALTLAALLLPIAAKAGKFQEPTKEELQMTSDPKAPGAAAVYLYREEETDNATHTISCAARIKVLTEAGKEWATVEVPYVHGFMAEPVIEGRTIHSDGTVIPLVGKASDLLVFKSHKNHVKAAVFNLPSVEVGSILEYKWSITMVGGKVNAGDIGEEDYWASAYASSTPEWDVQQELFVHKAHYYFNPFSSQQQGALGRASWSYYEDGELASYLMFTQRLPGKATVKKSPKDDYTLDVEDIPAISHESNSPPENSFLYKVRFFYSPYQSAADYWNSEGKRWSKQVDEFANVNDTIRGAANQITADANTPEAKARKLYDAVEALDNTDFTRVKSEDERKQLHLKKEHKKAQDVWNEKSGSGYDLAALYLALARAVGLNADGLAVVDRDKQIFDANLLSLHQFDSLLVVLHLDGKDIYLDPGEKLCPFGQLHWSHTLAGGLQENVKGPIYTQQNSTKEAITARTADFTLDATGGVTGSIKILMNGPEALYWRQKNLTSDAEEVKKQFNETLHDLLPQGVSGEVDRFINLDTYASNLAVIVKVTGQLGNATGKRLLVPGFFFSTGAHPQFVSEEKRETAIDLHFAAQIIDDVIYHLPAGFTVESAPQPTQLLWPEHAALVVKSASGTGSIELKHIFARSFVLLDPKEYKELRDYYQKIATNDQQQLVLLASAATASN